MAEQGFIPLQWAAQSVAPKVSKTDRESIRLMQTAMGVVNEKSCPVFVL